MAEFGRLALRPQKLLSRADILHAQPPGTVAVPPDVLDLHPASDGRDSVVRWSAPLAGVYEIIGFFEGLDFVGPTTTDTHVLVNGVSIIDIPINNSSPGACARVSRPSLMS